MRRTALDLVALQRTDNDLALAERLFENLRTLILDGVWRYGERLPGTRVIARDAGVSRWTAVAAIDMLAAEGLIEARSRSGHYVAWRGDKRDVPAVSEELARKQAFDLTVPALDLFPIQTWRRLQSKRWRLLPAGALDDGYPSGWMALRQAIAEFAASVRGISCGPDQVFIVPSIEAASRLTALALCRPGAAAWIEDPGPREARAVAHGAQLVPVPVPVDREGIVVDFGLRVAPQASIAVVTPTVQLPTGVRLSDERRRKLLLWAQTQGGWILEVDHTSEYPFGRQLPIAAQPAADRVIYFDTFGKMLFPSLRIAYLIVPKAEVERFQKALERFDRPPPLPVQIVLSDFLSSGQFAKHLRRCRDAYTERRRALTEALANSCAASISVEANRQALFVVGRLAFSADDVELASRARAAGVMVEPLSSYYIQAQPQRGLLFGFAGFRPEELRAGVEKLAHILDANLRGALAGTGAG